MTEWYSETLHEGIRQTLEMTRILFRQQTDHQDMVIFDNPVYGRVLGLDGVVQTTTGDEFVYHEMIAYVPLLAHGAARHVLIIGGGDGGTLRRCLEHPVDRVTMVELDRTVVDLCTEHLPQIASGAFDDPRVELVFADGSAFVKSGGPLYDVIIVDSTDPIGPGEVLFTDAFFADCKRRLAPGGVFVNQCGVPAIDDRAAVRTLPALRRLYTDGWAYQVAVPAYIGGIMIFGWGTENPGLRQIDDTEIARRAAAIGLDTRFHTPALHAASFVMPKTVLALLA